MALIIIFLLSCMTIQTTLAFSVPTTLAFPKYSNRKVPPQNSRSLQTLQSVKVPLSENLVSGICAAPGVDIVISNNVEQEFIVENASTSATAAYDWSFIDQVYLITCPNADFNSERITKTRETLASVGLTGDMVQIREFETDDEDRIRGCYTSHLSVLKEAQTTLLSKRSDTNSQDWFQNMLQSFLGGESEISSENNEATTTSTPRSPKVLVFEDNLDLTGNLKQSVLDIISNFSDQNPWDMIHLSYTAYVPNLTIQRTDLSNNLVLINSGIGSALGTTAYLISLPGINAVIEEDNERGYYAPIPDIMAKLFPESRYAAFPVPFLRAPKTKSLVNPQLDELRSLLFQPMIYTKVEQLLVYSGLSTNVLLPIVIVLLTILSGLSGKVTIDALYELGTTGSYDGNVLFPLVSSVFSIFSLLILGQGIALAPKPVEELKDDAQ